MIKKHRRGTLYKRGNVYWLKYNIEGRRICQSLETNKLDEAESKQAEIMRPIMASEKADAMAVMVSRLDAAKVEAARLLDEANPPLAVSESWTSYEKAPNRPDSGPATLETYSLQWGCFTSWLAEAHPTVTLMRDVSKEIAAEYAAHLTGRQITANTFNKHVRVCELVFRVLKDKARISENPFSEIQRKRLMPQHHRELTTDELKKVCRSAEGELRLLLALGLYLGARLGDAALMEWGAVDMKKGLIRYIPRKTARRSGKILTVPLHPVLIGLFSETPPPERTGFILPVMAKLYNDRGPYAVARIVQAHFVKCGLKTTRDGNGCRKVVSAGFHSLRHSAVSLLREAGAPLSVTMAIVGHSTLSMHDTYTHAGEGAMKSAVASLPSILADSIPEKALKKPRMVPADAVQALAAQLNGKTWRTVQAAMEQLASSH